MGDPRVPVRSPIVPVVWALGSAALAYLLMGYTERSLLEVGVWAILLAEASLVSLPASSGNRLSLALAVSAALPFVLSSAGAVDLGAAGAASAMGLLGTWMFRTLRSDPAEEVMAAVLRHGFGVASYLVLFAGIVSMAGAFPAAGVAQALPPEAGCALVELETPGQPPEYWVGLQNFYTLTRYNRSSFYAIAVLELAREIARAAR